MLIFLLGVPTVALANYFDGGVGTQSNIRGADATIGTANYPAVYDNFSCAWSMVANTDAQGTHIQVGWMKRYASAVEYFFEYANDGEPFHRNFTFWGPAQNSSHDYKVVLQNGTWYGTADGAQIGTVSDSNILWTPNSVHYAGEIVNYNQAFPGQTNNHVPFTNVKYLNGSTWVTPSLSKVSDYEGGFSWITVGSEFDIWDQRY